MRRAGFTLVETALVIALAGFLIQAGSITFRQLAPKFQLQSGVWTVHTGLSRARFKAIWTGTKARVRFDPSAFYLETYNEETKSWRLDKSSFIGGVNIQANNNPVFHPQGTVSDLASIYVSNSRGIYKITIAISGRIKVQKTG